MITEKDLWERIDRAIRELIKPPVLTSQRWLRHYPNGKPADFQFMGTLKLAKATGKDVHRIAGMLLRRLDPEGVGLTAEVAADGVINFRKKKPRRKAETPETSESHRDNDQATPEK